MFSVFPPQHRRQLYDLFSKSFRVRRSMIQLKLSQELGDVSKTDVDRVLHVRGLKLNLHLKPAASHHSNPLSVVSGLLYELRGLLVP